MIDRQIVWYTDTDKEALSWDIWTQDPLIVVTIFANAISV